MYGIVANIENEDIALRNGAKCWAIRRCGDGGERMLWDGLNKQGRRITKWVALKKFRDIRCAWIPPYIQDKYPDGIDMMGTRNQVQQTAKKLKEKTNVKHQGEHTTDSKACNKNKESIRSIIRTGK
jgi:hypothetical protein